MRHNHDPLDWLVETLALAVPLEMARLARIQPSDHREKVLAATRLRAGAAVGNRGDALLWPSQGRRPRQVAKGVTVDGSPGTAEVVAVLAAGLAAAAFAPGGATFHGRHWCAQPSACPTCRAEAAA